MNEDLLQVQSEVILNNLDLTSLEVDRIVRRWHEAVGFIPEGFFDNAPAGFAETHALAKLQQIAVDVVRERPFNKE